VCRSSSKHLLKDMVLIAGRLFQRTSRSRSTSPGPMVDLGDATQIHQALMNLCVNARDAMPSAARSRLCAANVTVDETFKATASNRPL